MKIYDDNSLTINILKNDINLYDQPISLSIVTELQNGYSSVMDDQTIKPNFESYFLGMDSLQYEVCDVENDCSQAWAFFVLSPGFSTEFNIPSGFSPNNDDKNDAFKITEFQHYSDIYIKIIDRSGMLVYENKFSGDNCWDGYGNKGTFNGKLAPVGTYYYLIKLKGFKRDITGFIYLNR
jgi:gliding motility-associated-like protein